MHALENAMLHPIDLRNPFCSRSSPSQEYNPSCPLLRYYIDYLLCELLPAFVGMAVGLGRSDSQTSIQEQHTPIGPWSEEPALVRRGSEVCVFFLEELVDVLERRRGRGGWADRKAETVGLIRAMIRVLTENDDFHG